MTDRLGSLLAATLLAFSASGEGSLVWCFEGRDFDSWRAAAPILTQHWAQASFKVTGEFDAAARQVQSELAAYPDFFQVAPDFARLADGYAEEYHPVVSAWTARKFAGADFGRLDAAVTGRLAAVVARLAREDEVICCRFRGPIDLAALKFVVTAAEKSRVWVRGIHACPEESQFAFTRQRLFPGFDGKFCKTSPCVATDWRGTALLTYERLLLSGSDVTYGQYLSRSTDGGRTWSAPKRIEAFPDCLEHGHRITMGAAPRYSRHHGRWFGLGCTQTMMGDQRPLDGMLNGQPTVAPIWAPLNAERGEFGPARPLPFPLPYSKALPYGAPVETETGELIVPFYFCGVAAVTKAGAWSPVSEVVCVSYRFDGDELKVARVGRPLAAPELKRGLCEPSLVRFRGRYYLTLRSDEYGAWAESADGLDFGEVRPWVWEDGRRIGNRNTQQHWLAGPETLYLAYTRETATNGHVFRNRAPVYAARFDPERGCLVRETEFPLVPELGARLGNFQTISDGEREAWLITAEWMQPVGCERYGSDNSLWFVKLFFPH